MDAAIYAVLLGIAVLCLGAMIAFTAMLIVYGLLIALRVISTVVKAALFGKL